MNPPATPPRPSGRSLWLPLLGLLLVGLNLRPALTSVAPVLPEIGRTLGLGSVSQGLLTTLPVLCLGACAPLAPRMAHRIGAESAVLLATLVLAAALLARPMASVWPLFAGTVVAGGCIGVIGVLLPGIVKRDFPTQVGLMTGLYTFTLTLGASIAAGFTEPLRLVLNQSWRPALAFWCLPALVAVVTWFLAVPRHAPPAGRRPTVAGNLLRDGLAWDVTLYMGLQSSLAYIVFGWLPTILQARGLAAVPAGWALSLSVLMQVTTALAAPTFATRYRTQSAVNVALMGLIVAGLAGTLYAPVSTVWEWIIVLGLGQGGSFAMALTLLALRAPDPDTANRLSAMAQGVGYVIAALGPLAAGLMHARWGNWGVTGGPMIAVALLAAWYGWKSGRDRLVGQARQS